MTRRRARDLAQSAAVDAEAAPDDVTPEALDDFDTAARLFSFTGEMTIPTPEPAEELDGDAAEPVAPVANAANPRPDRRGTARSPGASLTRMAAASFSLGVMAIVGVMTIGMTTPAEAVAAPSAPLTTAGDVVDAEPDEIQAFVVPAQVLIADLDRTETYSTGTLVDLAGVAGISNFSSSVFSNDPSCRIQWPFAVGVTMSYGFGMRSGRMHEGTDFTPGEGAHIQAIADGVVRTSTDSGGAYGVTVIIDHVVDGQRVSSRYGHMQYGSRQVQAGDTVSVGEYIGRTGNTGRSYGAHTHVEILQSGTTPIDPLPWLRSHASC